jgi:hypothetical protein
MARRERLILSQHEAKSKHFFSWDIIVSFARFSYRLWPAVTRSLV